MKVSDMKTNKHLGWDRTYEFFEGRKWLKFNVQLRLKSCKSSQREVCAFEASSNIYQSVDTEFHSKQNSRGSNDTVGLSWSLLYTSQATIQLCIQSFLWRCYHAWHKAETRLDKSRFYLFPIHLSLCIHLENQKWNREGQLKLLKLFGVFHRFAAPVALRAMKRQKKTANSLKRSRLKNPAKEEVTKTVFNFHCCEFGNCFHGAIHSDHCNKLFGDLN